MCNDVWRQVAYPLVNKLHVQRCLETSGLPPRQQTEPTQRSNARLSSLASTTRPATTITTTVLLLLMPQDLCTGPRVSVSTFANEVYTSGPSALLSSLASTTRRTTTITTTITTTTSTHITTGTSTGIVDVVADAKDDKCAFGSEV